MARKLELVFDLFCMRSLLKAHDEVDERTPCFWIEWNCWSKFISGHCWPYLAPVFTELLNSHFFRYGVNKRSRIVQPVSRLSTCWAAEVVGVRLSVRARFVSSSHHLDQLPISWTAWGSFRGGKATGAWSWPPTIAEIKDTALYISTPNHFFMVYV
jgi:hypothetical protein